MTLCIGVTGEGAMKPIANAFCDEDIFLGV